jgi:hypothetical protein
LFNELKHQDGHGLWVFPGQTKASENILIGISLTLLLIKASTSGHSKLLWAITIAYYPRTVTYFDGNIYIASLRRGLDQKQ